MDAWEVLGGDLEGSRILVLGGTSGIGLALVEALVEVGAEVVAGSRTVANIEQAMDRVGDAARFVQVDVLDEDALDALFADEAPVAHVVNAATGGNRAVGPFAQMELANFRASQDKFLGSVNVARIALDYLSDEGSITLLSGSAARKTHAGMSAIATSGAAIEGFCRAVAGEIGPRRINVVSPGVIDTPLLGNLSADQLERLGARSVIGRPGIAAEVAAAILLVMSNRFMTGTVIDVDGGAAF